MKEEAIITQLELRVKKLKKHFVKLQESFDPEELHDYRLEVKKLKAFIRLLNASKSHHKKIRLNHHVKSYYKLAGNVRNLELHEKRILELVKENQLNTPVTYLALLEKEKKNALEQLQQAEQTISFEQLRKEVQDNVPSGLSAGDCKSYLINQRHAIAAIVVSAMTNDEALHEVRKIVKDIGYNRDYLSSSMSLILPVFLINKEHTDALAETLGVFHDYCVSLSFLQLPHVTQIKDEREKVVLKEIQDIIESKKANMKKSIMQQLLYS